MYIPHTLADIATMLKRCNMNSLADLYADVPAELQMKAPYALPAAMEEQQVADFFEALGSKNRPMQVCLAGCGWYDHYTPAAISSLLARSEFATAYTPYQPEISQGTLQYIFEYQSMMSSLTGMAMSNASMYDSTTAAAEAMMMMVAAGRKRNTVIVASTLLPAQRNVVDTYAKYHGVDVVTAPEKDGVTDRSALSALIAEKGKALAGVIMPQPNRHGIVEDLTGLADELHSAKALLAISAPASTLAVLRTPGEWGADIACGDAQSLGIPLSYGGPYIGYMCCTKELMRKLPGRVVGATTDAKGNRCFVLTLQAREQHIRRQKATSNICSNQGLMSLHVTIYMSLLGPDGLREVNVRGHENAEYLRKALCATGRMKCAYPDAPILNEFEMDITGLDADALFSRSMEAGILPGVLTAPSRLLIACTERQSREQLDRFIEIVKSL